MRETMLSRHKVSLVFTARPHMSFTVWLLLYTWSGSSLPEDPWETLLPFLAIIIVWPLVLEDMLRRMLK